MASATSKAKDETQQAQTEVDSLNHKIKDLLPDSKKPEDKKASLGELQAAIPGDPKVAEFLRQQDAILKASGVQLQTMTPGAITAAGAVGSINVSIAVNGSESAVNDYISRLGKMPRLVTIDTVNFTPTSLGDTTTGGPRGGPAVGQVFAVQETTGSMIVGAQISARVFTSAPPVSATSKSSSSSRSGASSASAK
jgi:hypothetical protein